MKTLGRIAFLGLFAAIGTALAVGTAFSIIPSSTRGRCEFLRDRQETELDGLADAVSNRPHLRPAVSIPFQSFAPVPNGPLEVQANPPLAQQVIPALDKSSLQRVIDMVQQRLAPQQATPAPARQAPPGNVSSSAPPAAISGPAPTLVNSTVSGEGDGKLSIHIPNEPLRAVLDVLSQQGDLNILASSSVQGNVSATLNNVDVHSALDAILKSSGFVAKREDNFIFVGTPAEFQVMEQAMDKIGTRIYRPNYVTAAELQALITPLLSEQVGVVSVSTPAETGIGADDSQAGGDAFAGAEVVVVRDYEAVLSEIDQVLDQVDVRPMQVAIEAMILSVKLDDESKLGFDFEFLRNKGNLRFGLGNPANALPEALSAGGLQFAFLDSSLSAFVNALEEIKDIDVIATPRLTVLNKHRADIQIGKQEGYVSTTATETSTTQSVEFLDTGTMLRLRPFVSSDGMIRMEIHPELSSGEVKLKGAFTVPEKEVTQVTTNVMVRDGCTVIIGGLIREELVSKPTQVPFFGNLPLVGAVFRSTTEEVKRDEILVLITPRIVYEPEACREGDHAACEFHRRQSTFADKMMPFGKRYVGRKYYRLAQNAWAAGDRDTALRFAEMSVHFDPMDRAAIELRSAIWQGRPYGQLAPIAGATAEVPPGPMDGERIAPWLLDNLQNEPAPESTPLPPLDPGHSGPRTDIVRPRRLK